MAAHWDQHGVVAARQGVSGEGDQGHGVTDNNHDRPDLALPVVVASTWPVSHWALDSRFHELNIVQMDVAGRWCERHSSMEDDLLCSFCILHRWTG